MCGIAGYFGKKILVRNIFDEKKIISIMRSRGPDGEGTYEDNENNSHLKLFHTRLSIIDPLKRSHQPFKDNNSIDLMVWFIILFRLEKSWKKLGLDFLLIDTEVLLKFLNL